MHEALKGHEAMSLIGAILFHSAAGGTSALRQTPGLRPAAFALDRCLSHRTSNLYCG
jgi:hypothetical protein